MHVGAPMGKHGIVGWAPGFHSNFLEGAKWEKENLSDAPRGERRGGWSAGGGEGGAFGGRGSAGAVAVG